MLAELGHHALGPLAGHLDLVEGLDGGEPGGTALVEDGFGRGVAHAALAKRRRRARRSEGGRRRIAALVLLARVGADQGLLLVLDGEDAVADQGTLARRPDP